MKKICIFGGSFDPVHNGHIYLALDAIKQAELDMIYFVPARLQPFKLNKETADGFHRLNMLKEAVLGFDNLEVSSYELLRDDISYTINTLNHFKDISDSDVRIYFLTGTDSFIDIHKWMRADEILSSYHLIVGSRPGYMEEELIEQKKRIERDYPCEVILLDNSKYDISSTKIRDLIKAGKPLEGMTCAKVEEYIRENGLYR